jgi:cytochrome P450
LRPIVHWFIPECRRVRAGREATQRIAAPIVKAHLEARAANGGKSGKTSSVIGWIQDVARDKQTTVPMEDAQLFLAVAAIHTTTECLTYVMADLMSHPDAIPRLREEMSGVLKDMGWQKTSFSQMKLLDSVLKESQGLHPVSSSKWMHRIPT